MSTLWAVFAEVILIVLTSCSISVVLYTKYRKLCGALLIGFAICCVSLVLIQRPWRKGGAHTLVARKTIGSLDVAVVQKHDALSLNFTQFAVRDGRGKWNWYYLSHETPCWLFVGIKEVSTNEVDFTRLGVRVATFRRDRGEMVLRLVGNRIEYSNRETMDLRF
jgi:hypothetical protein